MLSRAREDAILHDADGGEELKGSGEKDGDRVEELGGVDEFVVLGEVDEDDGLRSFQCWSALALPSSSAPPLHAEIKDQGLT